MVFAFKKKKNKKKNKCNTHVKITLYALCLLKKKAIIVSEEEEAIQVQNMF